MSLKIAIVGNCQARPLAQWIQKKRPDIEIVTVAVVHLLTDREAASHGALFDQADIIVAQQVAPQYPCRFVTTAELRARHGDKVLSIVNLYYAGYNPELTYVRLPGGTLKGPLGDYHLRPVLEAWAAGEDAASSLALWEDPAWHAARYPMAAQQSMEELASRERQSDVPITAFIAEQLATRRLFHTMNHPSQALLDEFSDRVLAAIDARTGQATAASVWRPPAGREPLGQFRLPVNPFTRAQLGVKFTDEPGFTGLAPDGAGGYKGPQIYSSLEVVQAFREVYDAHRQPLMAFLSR